jgi:hypothetical protein
VISGADYFFGLRRRIEAGAKTERAKDAAGSTTRAQREPT